MSPSKAGGKLEDQAATAALYATRQKGDKSNKSDNYPLDADGKLSSASAATSLKHASPHDLPAYPIVGLQNTEASAGTAATLANANQKPFEHWKPGSIPAANKAATLAKDYKPDPLWQPELSAAGSKAALYADKKGGDVKIWRPSGTDAGHSAAGQAMRKKGLSPQLDDGHTLEGGRRALTAATGAMSSSRNRSGSTPTPVSSYPDASNSAANALKAATSAGRTPHKTQPTPTASPGLSIDAAKIHNQALTNLSREMYTSHPPVAPETEEKKKQDTLRAAAVSMAKKMYDVQQKQAQEAAALRRSDSQYAANSATDRPQSSASSNETAPPQYANLQEAAKKLAAERLAKLHDEHAAYRNYYGTQKPQNRKLSIRGRRRASSDGQVGDSDEERSKQIRSEMSLFTDKLAQVDGKKRKQDRDSLLAAAQRNVRASMTAQDARVFNDTGKVSPAMMAEWEAKAKAKAESESEARLVNHGMVNIGGGKFLDQSEVDAIATAKVQPTLDEITDTAERHRERDEELRQQQLERERIAAEKTADDKERAAKTKEEWKRFRDEEKRDERARKEEAKARKAEEKRRRDEEKRKSRGEKTTETVPMLVATEESHDGNDKAMERLTGGTKEPESVAAKPSPGDEEMLDPTSPSTSEAEAIATNTAEHEPAKTIEEGERQSLAVSSAEEVARRVFAAPVEGESTSAAITDIDTVDGKAQELAIATSNTSDAPVVGAETKKAPSQSPTADSKNSTAKSQPSAPVATRIAPPATAVAPSTETTVSGPSTPKSPKSPKPKDSSKVSTWLKTKLSRRTSKATPVAASSTAGGTGGEKLHISEPKDPQVFVGGANLGDDTTKTSSEQGDSSMRQVALAGKEAGPVDAPAALPVSPTSPNEPTVSGALDDHDEEEDDESTSISSLSSDEDTRGRSAIRLADTLPQNDQPIFGSTAATHDRHANNATAEVSKPKESLESPSLDTASSAQRQPSSTGVETDDFEEARDTFESEKLAPPDKGVLGGEGRKSDSPARDSKFVEEL